MKVKELIKELELLDKEADVIVAVDFRSGELFDVKEDEDGDVVLVG